MLTLFGTCMVRPLQDCLILSNTVRYTHHMTQKFQPQMLHERNESICWLQGQYLEACSGVTHSRVRQEAA